MSEKLDFITGLADEIRALRQSNQNNETLLADCRIDLLLYKVTENESVTADGLRFQLSVKKLYPILSKIVRGEIPNAWFSIMPANNTIEFGDIKVKSSFELFEILEQYKDHE